MRAFTNEQVDGRRISSYFVPIARPRKSKGGAKQEVSDTEWTKSRLASELTSIQKNCTIRLLIVVKIGGDQPLSERLFATLFDIRRVLATLRKALPVPNAQARI